VAAVLGPTVTSPPKPAESSYHSGFGSSSSDSIDQARFTPGTMLTDRYRIVGLLGKGGMGEVYRADDLKLRQPVALKFLPEQLSQDPRKLERFLHEVRVARQVSHPNVCRVYDIVEAKGQHFISMEYVDGEDLAAVIRRLGRPSKEKGLQIARQLCAGLAAAHDKGVLHRDLKPHNVMIDGQGRVRITDFGLAGFAGDFAGKELYAGTPAYMAPEQLAGKGVSVKSDIYSLGVVLCELFTGKRLFDGATRDQVQRSRTSVPTTLATLSDDLDPAVERVILRCLEPEPTLRPSSALAVAAALPGGDPLAAALAAGETPSPEMVANAGEVGGMRPALAITCLVAILGGMFALVPMLPGLSVVRLVPLPKPPAALADRAGEILKKLGHTGPVVDTAHGFYTDEPFFEHIEKTDKSATRWDRLASIRPSPVGFWRRTSPRPLVPASSSDRIKRDDPPLQISHMANVTLDPVGRLIGLAVEPPQRESESADAQPRKPTDWSVLFSEAQIDLNHFSPTEPRWLPETYCDERAAWEGRFPDQPDVPIRIEVGAYRGAPTYLQIVAPWTVPWRMEESPWTIGRRISFGTVLGLVTTLVFAGVLLALRNLKLRRSDRAGADRLAAVCTVLLIASWVLAIDHVGHLWGEAERLRVLVGKALVLIAIMWLWYIALEPYVRRRWPHVLISWSRLLAGRIRDPLVGRDLLVGCVAAIGMGGFQAVAFWVHSWLGQPPFTPRQENWELLLGLRFQIGYLFDPGSVFFAMLVLFLLLGLRLLLRREWLAIAAVLAIQIVINAFGAPTNAALASTIVDVTSATMMWLIYLLVAIRFGLLALVFVSFFLNMVQTPAFWGLTGWQSGPSWTAILFITAITVYGFHTALAGRPLFRDELQEA
jgi:serine/threonine-protein kinase